MTQNLRDNLTGQLKWLQNAANVTYNTHFEEAKSYECKHRIGSVVSLVFSTAGAILFGSQLTSAGVDALKQFQGAQKIVAGLVIFGVTFTPALLTTMDWASRKEKHFRNAIQYQSLYNDTCRVANRLPAMKDEEMQESIDVLMKKKEEIDKASEMTSEQFYRIAKEKTQKTKQT